ncbi:hypothetical protein HNQ60_001021 [Povalibacter uvarum]|uniref:Uncharacterized protein n=1 Tax=Povalibacter uvarum TaxID=732238 RepID=A0A841HJH1_9GAMM|nr:hypothetical protein [Povalibacter uvarum]MBB6092175.1 hypothetical protein [Povalibacter uvarum]
MKIIRACALTASLTAGLAMADAPAPAAPSAESKFAGNWIVKGEFGDLKYTLSCFFIGDDQTLSGPCLGIREPLLRANGRLNEKSMQFKYKTEYQGTGLTLDYRGRVQSDGSFKGTVMADQSEGRFEATPQSVLTVGEMTPWILNVGFTSSMQYSVVCGFRQSGDRIKGPCAISQGATLQARGRIEGDNVSFEYDTQYEGRPIRVEYSGTLQADGALQGTIKEGSSAGVFSAERP